MIFRAAALSLVLFIGIGAVITFTTNYTEAGSPNSEKGKKKYRKYKKFSKTWWRAYRSRLNRERNLNARKRTLLLRSLRLANAGKIETQINRQNNSESVPTIQTDGLFILVEGKIKKVFEGDSFSIETIDGRFYLVRMLGADAPPLTQDFGGQSQKALNKLILGKVATVIIRKKDSTGLYVGTVYCGGEDINLKQIENGMAFYFRQNGFEPKEGDRQRYEQAEQNAQNRQTGLWRKQKSGKTLAMMR